jgi:Fe2+ transport system protein FeoA
MFEIQSLSFKDLPVGRDARNGESRKPDPGGQTRLSLPKLEAGDTGTIERVSAKQKVAKRLADLGFVRGARIKMVRPGVPCIVRIGGTCVGLGRAHQTSIQLSRVS